MRQLRSLRNKLSKIFASSRSMKICKIYSKQKSPDCHSKAVPTDLMVLSLNFMCLKNLAIMIS